MQARATYWLLIVAAIFIPLVAYWFGPLGSAKALVDPDCYQWLVLVEKWEAQGFISGWRSFHENPRSNAPGGEKSHWTKPFGLALYLPAKAMAWISGISFRTALWNWALWISPVLFGILMLVLLKTWQLLLLEREELVASLLLLISPGVLSACTGGRPDHHSLQLVIFAVVQWALLAGAFNPLQLQRWMIAAGSAAAIGLWVGVEAWVLIGASVSWLTLLWTWRGKLWLEGLSIFSSTLALGVFGALILEHSTHWQERAADSLSATTVGVAVLLAGLMLALKILPANDQLAQRGRMLTAGLTAIIGIFLAAQFFPEFLVGPTGGIESNALRLWMQSVSEFEPLLFHWSQRWPLVLAFLASPLIPILYLIAKGRSSLPDMRLAAGWLWVALATLVYTALTLWSGLRWASYAQIASMPAWALVLMQLTKRFGRWQMIGALVIGALPVMMGVMGESFQSFPRAKNSLQLSSQSRGLTAISEGNGSAQGNERFIFATARSQLPMAELGKFLNTLPPRSNGKRPVVLAFVNTGPELLYRSNVSVVSTPYHRNGLAILDEWKFFSDTSPNADQARTIVRQRGINYVLVCPGYAEERAYYARSEARSLHERLREGKVPQWLKVIPLPKELPQHAAIFKAQ